MSRLTAAAGATAFAVSALGAAAYWTAFRPRSQVFGTFPYAAETDEKLVALSFDDGPNEPYTSRLLDTLDEYQVKATFFQVGRCAQRFPSCTRRVVQSGHVLGNHSYSHSFSELSQAAATGDRDQPLPGGVLFDHWPYACAVSPALAVPLAVGAEQSA